jgi:hypothetical protein
MQAIEVEQAARSLDNARLAHDSGAQHDNSVIGSLLAAQRESPSHEHSVMSAVATQPPPE